MRVLTLFLLTLLLGAGATGAQDFRPQPGDPPVAARISIEAPNADGIVRISGAQGSVFGNATLAVRNVFTGETVYTQAGGLGSWSVSIFGPGATPFWISPHQGSLPPERQAFPGSLPGGPGIIVYGTLPAPPPDAPVTQIIIDGATADWSLYPGATTGQLRALVNADSLYVGVGASLFPRDYALVEIVFTIDTVTYGVRFDPRRVDLPLLRRLNPNTAELDVLPANYFYLPVAGALEARIPLNFVDRALRVTFDQVRWLAEDGTSVLSVSAALPALPVTEQDGIVRPQDGVSRSGALTFDVGGRFGGRWWTAQGRAIQSGRSGADALRLRGGDTLRLELDMRLALNLVVNVSLRGRVRLVPFALAGRSTSDGEPLVAAYSDSGTNFGWTSYVTASGLPIDGVEGQFPLVSDETQIARHQIVRRDDNAIAVFPMDFLLTLPDDLPSGLYVPLFEGELVYDDGTIRPWTTYDSDLPVDAPVVRLPLVVNVGVSSAVTLPWALLVDSPSDGGRGILPDGAAGALSTRVQFNPPTYILPPAPPGDADLYPYSLEPYLPMLLPNRYGSTSAPLIPLRLPGGQIAARVTAPDGSSTSFGVLQVAQNELSSPESDEAALFGTTSPVDLYRLSTLDRTLRAFSFEQYGEYSIDVRGEVQDIFGNRYSGGGVYRVLIAEHMDMLPNALPGTPFETGDVFGAGVHVYPAAPASVRVTLRVYPLDGAGVIEQVFEGRANRFGVFVGAGEPFIFQTPGEYTVEYEARYTDADGRLWAASLRTAGVIAARAESGVIAHGTRSIDAQTGALRQAWYEAATLGLTGALTTYFPYHSGDILWKADAIGGIRPSIHLQDLSRSYRRWLLDVLPPDTIIDGVTLQRRAVENSLPVGMFEGSDSYSYVSAVRPGVTARQLVDGSLYTPDPGWTPEDPFNRQIGAGFNGDRPGDYTFLFGGAVVRAGDFMRTAIYGSLLVTIDPNDPRGTRVYPPGRGAAGAGDGGALVTVDNTPVQMFFHPTAIRPGDILRVGDTFALAGQVAPPLPAVVSARVIAPSGMVRELGGTASRIGYFNAPAQNFALTEAGLWTVEVRVQHEGGTSAGMVEPPYPSGGVLGGDGARYYFYVLASDLDLLDWNARLTDSLIPPAVSYNFGFTLPAGWRTFSAHYTLATPAYIIETGEIRLSGRSFTYLYNPTLLGERYPFLENITRSPAQLGAERAHVTDQRILTFYATGIDETGAPRHLARTFLLWYDRLISLN